jgi:dihydrofolate synthase / folylpolyglutamate synthase
MESRSNAILERLAALHPRKIDLSLERIDLLLERLGRPERKLPPFAHVAGTNGKGSTIAFMRAVLEAAGRHVHVYTSPHLISFRERFRLAGELVDEERLAAALEFCERLQQGEPITSFEITTAVAFHLFASVPADALLLEVGLGGRFDATNVVERPAVSVITPISLDHQEFLGSTVEQIAGEKAGVIKPGAPVVVARQPVEALRPIEREALRARAPLILQDRDFHVREENGRLVYEDEAGLLDLPMPRLPGRHQAQNAATAIAALRAGFPGLAARDFERGLSEADWPARLQVLARGRLVELAPRGAELWLDGGHNEAGGRAAAEAMADFEERSPKPLVLVCGMLSTKDSERFLASFRGLAQEVLAVSFAGESARPAAEIAAAARRVGLQAAALDDVEQALTFLAARSWTRAPRILIAGSLHLAGEVLERNGNQLA